MKKNISFFSFYPVRNLKDSMQFGVIFRNHRVYSLLFALLLITGFIGCTGKLQFLKKENRSEETINRPKKINPAETRYQLAEDLVKQGKEEEALSILKELLQITTNDNPSYQKIKLLTIETLTKLVHKYFSRGEYEKTITYFRELKELDQAKYLSLALLEEKAYRLSAEKFIKEKNYSETIKIYEKMGTIYPEKNEIYKQLIQKVIIQEKTEKAEKLFKQGAYEKAAVLYQEIYTETKRKQIKLRLSETYLHLGEISCREKNYPQAKEYWQKSLQFAPSRTLGIKILFSLAEVFREEENWQEAEKYYLQVLELDKEKKYAPVFLTLGKYYRENKLYSQAKEYYEKYLLYSPELNEKAEVYQELSQVLSYLGSYREAYENLLQVKKLGLKMTVQYPFKFQVYCLFRSLQTHFYIVLGLIFILFTYFYRRYKLLHFRVHKERKTLA